MAHRKTYAQFCALARALDHVGDRWTLLVVRELLLGRRTYRALAAALPGIGPNLLVDRLRGLEADGLIRRNDAPARSKTVSYALTEAGLGLRPAVFELIRWGARWMAAGPGTDRVDPHWAILALGALLEGTTDAREQGRVHLDLAGEQLSIELGAGRRQIRPGPPGQADARVVGSVPAVLAVASGLSTFEASTLAITGNVILARAVLTPVAPAANPAPIVGD